MDETSDGKHKVQEAGQRKMVSGLLYFSAAGLLATHPQYHSNRSKCKSGRQHEEQPGPLIQVFDHDCSAVGRLLWHRKTERTLERFSYGRSQ